MTDGGLFGDLDVASAKDNPFFKPDDTYKCKVIEVQRRVSQKGNMGLNIKYQIVDGPKKGQSIREWKVIPWPWQVEGYATEEAYKDDAGTGINADSEVLEKAEQQVSFLKQRMRDFGFPDEQMNSILPQDILAIGPLKITIKNKDDRENVVGVKLVDEDDEGDPFA